MLLAAATSFFVAIMSAADAPAARADWTQVPGVVIDHVPAASGIYIGSPSIASLPDGRYVASHDEFGPKSSAGVRAVTRLFSSEDRGRKWRQIAMVRGAFWSSLFTQGDALYLMGTARENGDLVIRRSIDGGQTWTEPRDDGTGLISRGRYHCAPVPVARHAGRIWRAMEDTEGPGGWGTHFRSFMMSAPVDADLLRAASWTFSNRLGRDPAWLDGTFRGWLEGNAVVGPAGDVVNILRVDNRPRGETAAMVHISPDGKTSRFDPTRDFLQFPGGTKKFTIRFDEASKLYWTLSNPVLPQHRDRNVERTRNAVGLMSSPDLRNWTLRCVVLYHPDPERHAFQYLDWLIEGDDLIVVSRTACDDGLGGAHNAHDANFMTFHRLANFRRLTPADSVPGAVPEAQSRPVP